MRTILMEEPNENDSETIDVVIEAPMATPPKSFVEQVEAIIERGFGIPEELRETDAQILIAQECDAIKELLLEKNRKYGNAALAPLQIFSKSPPSEQINVRLDDKLNRIMNRQDDEDEDVEWDLLGYLILKRVASRLNV